ncbi:MAG: DUF721 domain-containing protein [Alphaproteobacteria bacterium]|nr:DUF721 domain-containing protein [Alphaproteobacteria bacterium]
MRPLSESTARVSGKCFERKYISLGRIVKHWADIVGPRLADKAAPIKIHYRKGAKGKKPTTSLDIAVDSANATALHYQKGLIIEKINRLFGDDWITGIRFVHIPVNQSRPAMKKALPPLNLTEKKLLSETVSRITDSEIQERLLSLGEAIAKKNK